MIYAKLNGLKLNCLTDELLVIYNNTWNHLTLLSYAKLNF